MRNFCTCQVEWRINYLIRKVVGVEDDFDVTGLADEGLRLLSFSAERTGLPPIRHIGFCISVHDLKCVINYLGFSKILLHTKTVSKRHSTKHIGQGLSEGTHFIFKEWHSF